MITTLMKKKGNSLNNYDTLWILESRREEEESKSPLFDHIVKT